jgi:DNA-binding NarL/FixJ family response regulator
MGKIRIALLDDNPLYLMAFADVIDAYGECRVVARAHSLPELMEAVALHGPDLIVADSEVIDQSVQEVLTGLVSLYGHIPILLMGFEPPGHLDLLRDAHPNIRYLPKDRSLDGILNALVYITNYCDTGNPGAGGLGAD